MRGSRAVLAPSAVLAAAAAFVACQTPTSMTIEVSTDVACEELALKSAALVVVAHPEDIVGNLDPASSKRCERTGRIGDVVLLPQSDESTEVAFKVVLGVNRRTEECGVVDTGEPEGVWAGCIVARRRLAFLEGEALRVDVPLYESCIGVPCEEGAGNSPFTTCNVKGDCVPADLDPEDCIAGCGEEDLQDGATTTTSTGSGDGGAPPATIASSTSGGGDGAATTSGGGEGGGGEGGGPIVCAEGDPCPLSNGNAGRCDAEGACVECLTTTDCPVDQVCEGGSCFATSCFDGAVGPTETDEDCGGTCPPCEDDASCALDGEPDDASCVSGHCLQIPDGAICAPCLSDDDCEEGSFCNPGTDDCEPLRPLGAACVEGGWCGSAICAFDDDETGLGVCCDASCDGSCVACRAALTSAPDGTCAPRPTGTTCGAPECTGLTMGRELRCTNSAQCSPSDFTCGVGEICSGGACEPGGGTSSTSGVGGSGGAGATSTSSTAGGGGDGGSGGAGPTSTSSTAGGGGDGGAGGTGSSSAFASSSSDGSGGSGVGGSGAPFCGTDLDCDPFGVSCFCQAGQCVCPDPGSGP